jgi:hypothetical protein
VPVDRVGAVSTTSVLYGRDEREETNLAVDDSSFNRQSSQSFPLHLLEFLLDSEYVVVGRRAEEQDRFESHAVECRVLRVGGETGEEEGEEGERCVRGRCDEVAVV